MVEPLSPSTDGGVNVDTTAPVHVPSIIGIDRTPLGKQHPPPSVTLVVEYGFVTKLLSRRPEVVPPVLGVLPPGRVEPCRVGKSVKHKPVKSELRPI